MKIIEEKDLSPNLREMLDLARKLTFEMAHEMSSKIISILNTDNRVKKFDFNDTMYFLQKIKADLFLCMFETSIHIAKQFPDTEFSSQELFERDIECIWVKSGFKKTNPLEYTGGIKKIKVEE